VLIIWDPEDSRLHQLRALFAGCGAELYRLPHSAALGDEEFSRFSRLAVVALGAGPAADGPGLQVVEALKQRGFKVLGYGSGVSSWPVGARARVLLAGAAVLLDSAATGFPEELRRLLAGHFRAEAERRGEEERTRARMAELGLVGRSRAMLDVFRWVLRVGPLSDLPVLITGETGTGKELLAQAIARLDPRRCAGPFVALNCSAITPGLAESELFGHQRGAFTGAQQERAGLIRSAQGGVLFLDEVGELDIALQAKLLRVLQENRVRRVGDDQEVAVDLRVLAATHRDLEALAREGRFRPDLLHRLNVLCVHVPPLRERPDDLEPLVRHFLRKYQSLFPAASAEVGSGFLEALAQVELPGNARQLENLVRRALAGKEDGSPLDLMDLPFEVWQHLTGPARGSGAPSGEGAEARGPGVSTVPPPRHESPLPLANILETNGWNLARSLRQCERLLVEAALRQTHGNQSQAAQLLGITPRSVYNKIRRHNFRSA
jgi:DNA-binding NtrC family response regulator